jgi:hypothetical protein
MNAAGYILAWMRKYRRRAHAPMILAHSLTSDFFGIEERAAYWPDFEGFTVWPATARLMWDFATSTGSRDNRASLTSAIGTTPPAGKSCFAPARRPSARNGRRSDY